MSLRRHQDKWKETRQDIAKAREWIDKWADKTSVDQQKWHDLLNKDK